MCSLACGQRWWQRFCRLRRWRRAVRDICVLSLCFRLLLDAFRLLLEAVSLKTFVVRHGLLMVLCQQDQDDHRAVPESTVCVFTCVLPWRAPSFLEKHSFAITHFRVKMNCCQGESAIVYRHHVFVRHSQLMALCQQDQEDHRVVSKGNVCVWRVSRHCVPHHAWRRTVL